MVEPPRVTMSESVAADPVLGRTLSRLHALALICADDQGAGPPAVHLTMVEPTGAYAMRTIVVDGCHTEDCQRAALARGAAALIDPGIGLLHLHAVILAVHNDLAVLPVRIASLAMTRLETPPRPDLLTPDQKRLLNLISRGLTMGDVSVEMGCSERQARRRFRQVRDLLGARDRTTGIIRATRYGMLGQP